MRKSLDVFLNVLYVLSANVLFSKLVILWHFFQCRGIIPKRDWMFITLNLTEVAVKQLTM